MTLTRQSVGLAVRNCSVSFTISILKCLFKNWNERRSEFGGGGGEIVRLCCCQYIDQQMHIIKYSKLKIITHKKVKQSHNRPGVAQRFPGGLDSQISMTFGTWRWWGCQPHVSAAFTPRKCCWYSFSLGAESTPGTWNGWKECVTEKSSDTTGNRSWDHLTSSTVP